MDTPDNASMLSNACAAIDRFRAELAATELELAELQVRRQCLAEFIEVLTGKPRTRRTRTPRVVEEAPQPEMELSA